MNEWSRLEGIGSSLISSRVTSRAQVCIEKPLAMPEEKTVEESVGLNQVAEKLDELNHAYELMMNIHGQLVKAYNELSSLGDD